MLEKNAVPGGVLQWGIPSFTLPDAPVQRPIEALLTGGSQAPDLMLGGQ